MQKEKKIDPDKLSVEPLAIKQLDHEIDTIQEIIQGFHGERQKIDENELQIIEHLKKIPGSSTEELNALKKQSQISHKSLDEKIEKLEVQQATLLAYRQELRSEIRGLIKTAQKADLKKPGVLVPPKVKPAAPKYGVEKMFALFKGDPKKIDSFKAELNLMPEKQRNQAITKLYQNILRQVKGNQNNKEYKAFEEFCHALQLPMVTLVLSNKQTYSIPKTMCEEYDYLKVKLEGKFLNYGNDEEGNQIIKFEEIAPDIQQLFARAIMYRTAEGIINANNVVDLLRTGDQLRIDWLTQACVKYLINNIDKDECTEISQ